MYSVFHNHWILLNQIGAAVSGFTLEHPVIEKGAILVQAIQHGSCLRIDDDNKK